MRTTSAGTCLRDITRWAKRRERPGQYWLRCSCAQEGGMDARHPGSGQRASARWATVCSVAKSGQAAAGAHKIPGATAAKRVM